jgi:hypothetical protein
MCILYSDHMEMRFYMPKFNNIDHKHRVKYVPTIYSPLHLAYLAGFVDGEGCFHACKLKNKPGDGYKNGHYRCVLKVSNTDENIFYWLQETFRGTCSAAFKETRDHLFKRPCFEWVVTGHRLLDLCEQLLPYLIVKKRHCELIIKFRKTFPQTLGRGNRELSSEEIKVREECITEISHLNRRVRAMPECKII